MKKIIAFFLLLSAAVLFTGCGKFPDGTSVWQGGLFIIPWLTGLGGGIFFYIAWLKSHSGSEQQLPNGSTVYSDENVPIWKIGQFYYGVALLLVTIGIIIAVNLDK